MARRAKTPVAKLHRVDQYAADVRSGAIVCGPLVRMACERHHRDRKKRSFPFVFDPAAADKIIAFFETVLRLPDVEDDDTGDPSPFRLLPWQVFVVGSLFGWKHKTTGLRRFRVGYIETGKGSGKSPLLAGIGLYGLMLDGELAPEVYSAATSRDQARVMFADAERIVKLSPEVAPLIECTVNNLSYRGTGGWFRPVSSEHRQLDGKRPHMGLFDEVHEHPNGLVINKIRAGSKRRPQPMFIEITNSGFDRTSVCFQHHEHSRRVLEQTVEDDRWFAYVCGLDPDDDPLEDEDCWPKANPGLIHGLPTMQYLRDQVAAAKNIPNETNIVLRLNFCVWTQAQHRFFDMTKWRACAVSASDTERAGRPCYAGLDLGQSDDFCALAIARDLADGRVDVEMRFWLPEGALLKFPDRPYDEWRRAGLLTITQGDVIDYDQVEDDVYHLCRSQGVQELAYDKRFASQLAQHLDGRGVTCVDTPQGFALNEPLKRVNEWVASEELCHGGNAILAWMADNTVVRFGRNGELRLDKEKSRDKIDGIAAVVMAVSRMIAQPVGEPAWKTEGLLILE